MKQKGDISWWQAFETVSKYYLIGIGTFFVMFGIINLILKPYFFGSFIYILFGVLAAVFGIVSKVSKSAE